jgi:hypothetical protein
MTTADFCPNWCTVGTDEHPCDGSHMHLDHSTARVASGSPFPIIDERGAIFPAVSAGINSSPSEAIGPHVFLWMTGPDFGDGQEVTFPLDQAFGLAVDLLEMYARAIQEIDRPQAPWPTYQALRPLVETIERNWSRRDTGDIDGQIHALKERLRQTDPVAETDTYDRMFEQLVGLERQKRDHHPSSERTFG